MSNLPVAILAGGLGTRLGPRTQATPKALMTVAGQPFLQHQFELLRRNGVQRVVLCISHMGSQIRDFAGDGRRFGLEVEYSWDGPVLLGTAGALKLALPLLGEAFFVLYGDSYLPCHFRDVAGAFRSAGKLSLMTVYENRGQWDDSNVEFGDGRIAAYDKLNRTPRMRHIDYGLGVFQAAAFDRVPPTEVFDLARLYRELLAEGQLAGYEVTERFYEIGSPQGLADLDAYLSARSESSQQ